MARRSKDVILAPVGMDHTINPAVMPPNISQNLVNLLPDRQGFLRGNVSAPAPTLSPAPSGSIDGIGWLYRIDGYSTISGPHSAVPGRLAVVAGGSITSYPMPATGFTYPPTFNAGNVGSSAFLTGQKVRFAGFGTDLFAVQQNNTLFSYQMKSDGTILQMGITSPFTYDPNLLFTMVQNPAIPASWLPGHSYVGSHYIVGGANSIWSCPSPTNSSSGSNIPTPPANPTVNVTTFLDNNSITWTYLGSAVTVQYLLTWSDNERRESSPSQPQSLLVWSSDKNVTLTTTALGAFLNLGSLVSYLNLYATSQNGSVFYKLPFSPSTTSYNSPIHSWAPATVYPAQSVVYSGGGYWITAAGGTSSIYQPIVPPSAIIGSTQWGDGSSIGTPGSGLTWTYIGPTSAPPWVTGTAYHAATTTWQTTAASIVTSNNGVWQATNSGTSGVTAPVVPANPSIGYTTSDGTVTWKYVGSTQTFSNPASGYFGGTSSQPASTIYIDSYTDQVLSVSGSVAPGFGENDPPLPASLIAVQDNRLILNSIANPAILQISNLNSGTQFASVPTVFSDGTISPTDGGTLQISTDQGNTINGFASFGSYLLVACRRGLWALQGTNFNNFETKQIHDRGCIAPDSMVRCDNHVAFLSDDGVYVASYIYRFIIEKFSKPIEADLQALSGTVNGYAQMEAAQSAFVNNCYYLGIGSTLYRYDFDMQGWTSLQLFGNSTITSIIAVQQTDTPRVLYVGLSNGTVCMIDEYTFPQTVSGMVYRTRILQPDPTDRDGAGNTAGSLRKRAMRAQVRGTGTLTGTNTITLTYDGKTEAYTLNNSNAALPVELTQGIIIGQGFSAATVGRHLDITLNLNGTGIVLSSLEVDTVSQG